MSTVDYFGSYLRTLGSPLAQESASRVEHLDPVIPGIRHVDIALAVHGYPAGFVKRPVRIAFVAPLIEEYRQGFSFERFEVGQCRRTVWFESDGLGEVLYRLRVVAQFGVAQAPAVESQCKVRLESNGLGEVFDRLLVIALF